jgi:Bor protein
MGRGPRPQVRILRTGLVVGAVAVLGGCFHAIVTTGRPAGPEVIQRPWASSFLFGLVPPEIINGATECPAGVASIETQHTFLNSLVGIATVGIYTPMKITVTCAGPGRP